MYVTLPTSGSSKAERSVSVVFETNSAGDYRWHLRVTQIDCRIRQPGTGSSNNNLVSALNNGNNFNQFRESRSIYQKVPHQLTFPAPTGCLQYFTSPSGTIESFNFGQYLNNMDYSICIERQPDTCRMIYTSSDANFGIEAAVVSTMPGVGDEQCSTDYLMLSGGSQNGEGVTKDRYCGGVLSYSGNVLSNSPVISKINGPIVIRFHSDARWHSTLKEGFRVKYEQSSTDCPVVNSGNVNGLNLQNSPNLVQYSPNLPLGTLQLQSGYDSKSSAIEVSTSEKEATNKPRTTARTMKYRSNDKQMFV